MYSGESRKVSLQDIQLVKNLIERCLQLYMTKREVVNTLFHQGKIEPGFTELVWQKLEAENSDFFRIYKTRLILKDQIVRFNQLLDRQVELMNHMSRTRVSWSPLIDRSQNRSMERSPFPRIKSENAFPVGIIPHDYTNGTCSPQQRIEVGGIMPVHAGRVDFPAQMAVPHNSNAGIMQGFDKRAIKTEGFYAGNSPGTFHADNLLDVHYRDFSISPFDGGESCSQSFSESLLDAELNSFGVEQLTQNFSLSDWTPPFPSTGITESYSGSPFVGTPTNTNYSYPQQGYGRLETTTSEDFSYEGFGSSWGNC